VEQDSGKKVEIQIMNANTPSCRSTKDFNPKVPTNNNNSCSRNNSNNDRYLSQQCQRMNLGPKIGTSSLNKIQIRPENLHFNRPAGSHTSSGGPGSNHDLNSLDHEINRIKGKYTPKNKTIKSPEFTGASPQHHQGKFLIDSNGALVRPHSNPSPPNHYQTNPHLGMAQDLLPPRISARYSANTSNTENIKFACRDGVSPSGSDTQKFHSRNLAMANTPKILQSLKEKIKINSRRNNLGSSGGISENGKDLGNQTVSFANKNYLNIDFKNKQVEKNRSPVLSREGYDLFENANCEDNWIDPIEREKIGTLVDTTHEGRSTNIFYEDHLLGESSGISDCDELGKMQEVVSAGEELGCLTYSP
jgi:hypothetical protein